ncbi:MAG: SIS domain-containing protein [Candidatus Aureabacteria bacterium]|nr:SIS domain-containing protein [Candidatus Auribacterota bacterium]
MEKLIIKTIDDSIAVHEKLKALAPGIASAARLLIGALKAGNKILICGNGGSAADSQHIAAELIGRFKRERQALPAIALTTDTSILTSLANDYAFDLVFARQVDALGKRGDILILISTSGNSPNLTAAARVARALRLSTLALLGRDGGKLKDEVDLSLIVPASDTARIQEGQSVIYHILCDLVEEAFCKS